MHNIETSGRQMHWRHQKVPNSCCTWFILIVTQLYTPSAFYVDVCLQYIMIFCKCIFVQYIMYQHDVSTDMCFGLHEQTMNLWCVDIQGLVDSLEGWYGSPGVLELSFQDPQPPPGYALHCQRFPWQQATREGFHAPMGRWASVGIHELICISMKNSSGLTFWNCNLRRYA